MAVADLSAQLFPSSHKERPQRSQRRGPTHRTWDDAYLRNNKNPSSELSSDDIKAKPYQPTAEQRALISDVEDDIQSAINYRRVVEGRYFEAIAMYQGNQNLRWNYGTRTLFSTWSEGDSRYRVRSSRNVLRPKVLRRWAKAFSKRPEASVKPNSPAQIDVAAAEEGKDALAHLNHILNFDRISKQAGKWAIITGMCGVFPYYDPNAWAEMPIYKDEIDKNGNTVPILQGSHYQQVGEIKLDIVPMHQLLLDPQARDKPRAAYIGYQNTCQLSEIIMRFPDFGPCVTPNAGQGPSGPVESRMASVLGEWVRGSEPGSKHSCAVVNTLFYPASPRYKKGRYVVHASGILLHEQEGWPGMDSVTLTAMGLNAPVAFMDYEQNLGSMYSLSAVTDAVAAQRSLNSTVSRMEEDRNTSWGKVFFESGSIPPDSFDDAKPNEKIPVKRGTQFAPKHVPGPEIPDTRFKQIDTENAFLDAILSSTQISQGESPVPGQVAYQTIQALAAIDAQAGTEFAGNIEKFHDDLAKILLHLVGQNYSEPRMLFATEGYYVDPRKKLGRNAVAPAPSPMPQVPQMAPSPAGGTVAPMGAPPVPQGAAPTNGIGPMAGQSIQPGVPAPGGAPQMQSQPAPAPVPPMQTAPPLIPETGIPDADTDNTDAPDAVTKVRAFRALADGGSCHLVIVPGSSLATDPLAERAEILELLKAGLFELPYEVARIVLSMLEFSGVDEIIPMMQAAQERLALEALLAAPSGPQDQTAEKITLENVKAGNAKDLEMARQQHDVNVENLKAQHAQEKLQLETSAAQQVQAAEHRMDSYMAILSKLHPDIRVMGQLTPQGEQTFEQIALGTGPSDQQVQEQHEANVAPAQQAQVQQQNAETQALTNQKSLELQEQSQQQEPPESESTGE